ncbi:MAG: acyl-CoA dehydrogenase [Vicingaceae bacterium]|nr:MAG: acyl-CoA dehydrogenase [Vicingaceae bacterium]
METSKIKALKGGEFLIKDTDFKSVFIPEMFDEEQKMIAETCQTFLEQEIFPILDRIDSLEEGLMPKLLEKSGELGMLGLTIPEEYGGLGKDFVTGMLLTEKIGAGHSFAVAFAAHTGIGTLPILYFGNEEQKKKYLPKLASGEWKASYCLTEPGSGSDANSGKTKATLSPDGKHYLINGQKMWITNAGFADLFIVFAKIDDDENLSAFIVEKGFGGIELNPEEKKMGIKGSSTRQVFFNNCPVPVENLLGERGEGFKIALYILNIGRIKLAGAALGAAKELIKKSAVYANEREQFGRPIGKYGAIKYKLAQQTIETYALESALYRCSKNIEDAIIQSLEEGKSKTEADKFAIKEYAIEAAILKVFGSEALDYVVDEAVQIYGGMGYSAEGPVERAYRDSRINRIFEGTNEINRLLIVDMLLKKAMKGELDLLSHAQNVAKELMQIPDFGSEDNSLFANEKKAITNFKKAILMVAGSAAQKLMTELAKEQEILMNVSDMIILTYVAESTLLGTMKRIEMMGEDANKEAIAATQVLIYDTADKIFKYGKDALAAFAEGDELRMMMVGLKRFTKTDIINHKNLRRQIADATLKNNMYVFS